VTTLDLTELLTEPRFARPLAVGASLMLFQQVCVLRWWRWGGGGGGLMLAAAYDSSVQVFRFTSSRSEALGGH
jgi:hypothetical protein